MPASHCTKTHTHTHTHTHTQKKDYHPTTTSTNTNTNINTLCFKKNGHPICFSYNFVSRDQIVVIFNRLLAKEICNRTLLTDLKEIAGALR